MKIKECDNECAGNCKARILVFRASELDQEPNESVLTDVIVTNCEDSGDDMQEVEDALFYEDLFTAELWAVTHENLMSWAASDPELRFWESADSYSYEGVPHTSEAEALRHMEMDLYSESIRMTWIDPESL